MRPALLTFDIFGTVLDWRRGLTAALTPHGVALAPGDFDRIIDAQARLESVPVGAFRSYREITALSLVEVCGLPPADADAIGAECGRWPPYPDSPGGLRRLLDRVACAAMTNSDRDHGEQAQANLGVRLTHWICAEEVRVYKPAPEFWHAVAARLGRSFGPDWWHVSAYADYDLEVAARLGLTTVFVPRPHARPGRADHTVRDLEELADLVSGS